MEKNNLEFIMDNFFIQIKKEADTTFKSCGHLVFKVSMDVYVKYSNEFKQLFGEPKKENKEFGDKRIGHVIAYYYTWNVVSDDEKVAFMIKCKCLNWDGENEVFLEIIKK